MHFIPSEKQLRAVYIDYNIINSLYVYSVNNIQ